MAIIFFFSKAFFTYTYTYSYTLKFNTLSLSFYLIASQLESINSSVEYSNELVISIDVREHILRNEKYCDKKQ